MKHVKGIDSIRCVAALWVVFGHGNRFPLTYGIDKGHWLGRIISGIYGNLFCGSAAVIVFFLISGFVIHYPYITGKTFVASEFFLRRYLRIGFPLIVAIPLARWVGIKLSLFSESILWSLFAELVYYSLYPAIRWAVKRTGWRIMLAGAYAASVCVILTAPTASAYPSYGTSLNWLLGLPCWLLGCLLAESWSTEGRGEVSPISTTEIYSWRLTAWALTWACSALRFHSPIGLPWTLNLFAIFAFFWLKKEIAYYNTTNRLPSRLLEWMGAWSYSLYLTHNLSRRLLVNYIGAPNLGVFLNWLVLMSFMLCFAYLFFLLFEKTSHLLARSLAQRLRRPQASHSAPIIGQIDAA
ncbi:MAG TPA: acyltransferase [Pirellulales bacterium]|nr:acyltransferase [Pirellulales bacterium]